MHDYKFVLFGRANSPLFRDGQTDTTLNFTLSRARTIGAWLQSKRGAEHEALGEVPATFETKVVAGRRPQPDSPVMQALRDLNNDLMIQVRTYDWLLDSALAIAEPEPEGF